MDDVFLVASELINNAIKETPGELILFRLSREEPFLTVAVWDSSPRRPYVRRPPNAAEGGLDISPGSWDDNGGWGLPIVTALAVDCGCGKDPRGGKWVWARLKP
ncbi:ATP-binding protein [Thermomonospora amylolytica]|uniref:ATP-binding protein n=1 Tax=Thermomonospora amylolytica TaxID=1411117 RepID=UPI000E6B7D8D|nr:ATP-binding protein [Thermomonospora amylolytica]